MKSLRAVKNNAVLSGLVLTMIAGAGNAVWDKFGNANERNLNSHGQRAIWGRLEAAEASNLSLSNEVYVLKNPAKKGKTR